MFKPPNPPITHWQGKKVWVVGASAGIGLALTELLIQEGAVVIASARRTESLSELNPGPAHVIAMDVSQPESIARALGFLQNQDATPDVVLWVAGVYHPMASDALNLDAVRETFEVNTLSAYSGLAQLLKSWAAAPDRQRHWVLVSSVAGYRGLPQAAAYGASKAALTYLAEVNYLELAKHHVAVSVVCPGFVDTRLTKKNSFAMPAIIRPEEAARETLRGLARGEFEIHYPKRFTRWLKLLSILPYRIYFGLIRKTIPKSEQP